MTASGWYQSLILFQFLRDITRELSQPLFRQHLRKYLESSNQSGNSYESINMMSSPSPANAGLKDFGLLYFCDNMRYEGVETLVLSGLSGDAFEDSEVVLVRAYKKRKSRQNYTFPSQFTCLL